MEKEPKETRTEVVLPVTNAGNDSILEELKRLRLQYELVMQTIKVGIIVLNADDVVTQCNEAALAIWGLGGERIVGKRLQNTNILFRCAELPARLEQARAARNAPVSFKCRIKATGDERMLSVTVRAIQRETGKRAGTILCTQDISSQDHLQSTAEQLEATREELRSAREELGTTNQQLQSTGKELEAANGELRSLNEELEKMNEQLKARMRELDALGSRYAESLRRMPWPVLLVDRDERIQIWNAAAEELFGVGGTPVVGVELSQLPIQETVRKGMLLRLRSVFETHKPTSMRGQEFHGGGVPEVFNIQFTPIWRNHHEIEGVLVMFSAVRQELAAEESKGGRKSKPRGAKWGGNEQV